MDLEILKERDMPLMSRKRFTLFAGFKGPTPTRIQLRDAISKKVKGEPELTVVKHIYNRYGIEKAKVIAHVYSKKEDMLRYEDKVLLDKHVEKKKEEKAEEKPTPAPAEAKPEAAEEKTEAAEEAKEESKEEKKE